MQKFCKYKKVYILKQVRASNDAGRDCGTYGKGKGTYRVLVGTPEKRPFGRHRRRWEDNIKRDLQEIRWWCGLNYLAKDRIK